jgi:hypothetical protein
MRQAPHLVRLTDGRAATTSSIKPPGAWTQAAGEPAIVWSVARQVGADCRATLDRSVAIPREEGMSESRVSFEEDRNGGVEASEPSVHEMLNDATVWLSIENISGPALAI